MFSPRWIRRALGVGALAVALSSCGSDSSPTEAATTADGNETDTELVDLADGGQIDIGALEGTDTVLWFWAPW